MKKLFLAIALFLVCSSAFAATISADKWAVNRSGKATSVSAPIISGLSFSAATVSVTTATSTANMAIVITLKDGTTANLLIRQ